MKNSVFKAYEKIDDGIMFGINKGVKAWNWTTGKSKSDLSNYLLDFSLIPYCLGILSINNSIFYPFVPIQFGITHLSQRENKINQKKEDKYLQKGLKSGYNPSYEIIGVSFGILSGYDFLASSFFMEKDKDKIGLFFLGLFSLSFGLSEYVMRAENFPPRKSAFKLAKEKLFELYEKYKPSLFPVPQPTFDSVKTNRTLEEILFLFNY